MSSLNHDKEFRKTYDSSTVSIESDDNLVTEINLDKNS